MNFIAKSGGKQKTMAAYDKSQYAPVANEYLNMLDMALDMSVSILDENLDYLYLNTATYESLGLTPDEIGPGDNLQRIHQLMHEKGLLNPEIIETNKLSQEQQVQRGPASRYSKVMRLADGRTMRLTRTQLENGHTISVSSDVTELVEKERLLEHSMRLGKSGYWEFDFSKSKLVLSDTLSAHFGRDQARMAISKGLKGMVQLIVPEDRPIAIKSLKKVMKGQKRIAYRVRSKNAAGKIIWSQNYGEVIYNKKNKPEKIRVFVIDITSDVKRSHELERAKDQALAASRAKSEFLANMSHEIRTPMNGILGMAELLANSDISAQKKQQVDIIYSSANALLNIINDILDFSKIEADALELDPVSFDLFEVVNEVAVLMSQAAQAKDLELIVNYESPRECHFIADAGRIRQIITNLVNNAIKFTEDGTIVINVDVSSNSESTNVVNICVKDTGIGIDNRKIEDIFANFTQADTSTTRRFGGTGLGLTISILPRYAESAS